MDNIREKLVELLREVQYLGGLEEKVADHLIANGVTVQEWIPVTERLPDMFCGVLVYCPICKNIYEVYLNARGEWHFFDTSVGGAVLHDLVTHWMPLPTPPKGE